jgi:hypothetical protein
MLFIIVVDVRTASAREKDWPKENPAGKQLGIRKRWYAIGVASEPNTQHKCWYIMWTEI